MLTKIVTPGDRVELSAVERVKMSGDQTQAKVYTSKVYNILSDERLEVTMPMEKTKLILLPVDGVYELYFTTTSGLYQCFARIIDRYKTNNVYLLALELTSNLSKHQRREYYRFSCALEMRSRELQAEEKKATDQIDKYLIPGLPLKQSVIVDISGGGLRFMSNHQYQPDSLIYINYCLIFKDRVKEYNVVGKVLGVKPSDNRPDVFEHRVQYVNIGTEDREEIIKYIFEEERKHRSNKK